MDEQRILGKPRDLLGVETRQVSATALRCTTLVELNFTSAQFGTNQHCSR